tara:strand:+ start:795 stop:1082 length:288 start_codon:yes stop_codon:yes gene_type:complete
MRLLHNTQTNNRRYEDIVGECDCVKMRLADKIAGIPKIIFLHERAYLLRSNLFFNSLHIDRYDDIDIGTDNDNSGTTLEELSKKGFGFRPFSQKG